MKIQFWFTSVLLVSSLITYSQTIEDLKKLELTEVQLRTCLEKRQILLTNRVTGKHKKLKEGAFATVKMKGDTARRHLILEAFLTDTIIVSLLSPELIETKTKLEFTELKLLAIHDIESIEYSVRHITGTEWTSSLITLLGLNMAILPLVMPLILGNTEEVYSQPQVPFIVAGGVVLFICGRRLYRTLTPKEYKLETEWQYSIVKK